MRENKKTERFNPQHNGVLPHRAPFTKKRAPSCRVHPVTIPAHWASRVASSLVIAPSNCHPLDSPEIHFAVTN